MEYGICLISMVPVRKEPSHKSEMVTQLLFGEAYKVTSKKTEWYKIHTLSDQYDGWISRIQFNEILPGKLQAFSQNAVVVYGKNSTLKILSNNNYIQLFPGSIIPQHEGNTFKINEVAYSFDGEYHMLQKTDDSKKIILNNSKDFFQSPYLWGGKTPCGTDCSGMIQTLYKTGGISMPRDASVQATIGETINFLTDASPGDLLFFDDEEGIINHTGLLLNEGKIIHASGMVKIDEVDHQGIFDKSTGKYTHRLRTIKKII